MNLLNDFSEFDLVYNRNVETVYRICFLYMKNQSDSEDMVQITFFKYLNKLPHFESSEHEKAWFIVVATNNCKNHFKSYWNRNVNYDDMEVSFSDGDKNILEAVLNLPLKYKQVIYMYYYEGYKSKEIAEILGKKESSIRTLLSKGRNLLKESLGSEEL